MIAIKSKSLIQPALWLHLKLCFQELTFDWKYRKTCSGCPFHIPLIALKLSHRFFFRITISPQLVLFCLFFRFHCSHTRSAIPGDAGRAGGVLDTCSATVINESSERHHQRPQQRKRNPSKEHFDFFKLIFNV